MSLAVYDAAWAVRGGRCLRMSLLTAIWFPGPMPPVQRPHQAGLDRGPTGPGNHRIGPFVTSVQSTVGLFTQ